MTTPENQNTTQQELEPFFPPILLLGIAAVGFFVALVAAMTPSGFNIVGWAGLLVGVIALVFWAIMNPKAVVDFVKGRGLAFGGTAIVVSIIVIVAAVLVYMVVDAQDWTLDFTEGSVLTLSDDVREVLQAIANDPTQGNVQFIAFADSQSATARERMELLLRQFEEASSGKITYEFVNPDRDPLIAQQYGANVGNGTVAVVTFDAEGNPLIDEAEMLTNPDQYALTNTTIEVLADGDFRAVFVDVPEGSDPNDTALQSTGSGTWVTYLRDVLGWTVEIVSPLELTTQAGLGSMASDGDVVIIAGGVDALPDDAITTLQNYVNNGGNLVLLAGSNLTGEPTLAAADNMGTFLQATYGVRVLNNLVIDDAEHFSIQALQLISDGYNSHPVTLQVISNNLPSVFSTAQSVEVANPAPQGVTLTTLVQTTENAYAKTGLDINAQIEQNVTIEEFQTLLAQAEGDLSGVLPLAVAADNTNTGSRLVVFGSDSIIWNVLDGSRGEANPYLMQAAIFWTTGYDEFSASLATVRPVEEIPGDQVTLQESDVSYIRFVTIILIPFGSLLIGIAIWWLRRERVSN